jgi:hypothetical protein
MAVSSRGVVVIAHNTMRNDYYRMATAVAERAKRFLNLPTTVITDITTLKSHGAGNYRFDNTIVVEPDRDNFLKNATWINKNRYKVYDLSPYDDTLVLDTDYLINSDRLLQTFLQPTDFCCYRTARYFFSDEANEQIGPNSHSTYWATVMRFTRSPRTQDIFGMIKLIQENYAHYAELHGFLPYTYRNDHALTIALRAVNGHIEQPSDFIPGYLNHVDGQLGEVVRVDDTTYNINCQVMIRGRLKKSTITVKDQDFHMLNKENYMSLIV